MNMTTTGEKGKHRSVRGECSQISTGPEGCGRISYAEESLMTSIVLSFDEQEIARTVVLLVVGRAKIFATPGSPERHQPG